MLTYLHKLFNIAVMKNPIENIIAFAGSPMEAARLVKETPQQVTNWRKRGMPKGKQLEAIERGVPASIVRPDLFPSPVKEQANG